jgi:rhodanese-related sulfurtransferase
MTLTTAAHLIAAAKAHIENLSPAAVAAEVATGEVLLVDIREAEERAQLGSIPGAIHTARGMLEFAADPTKVVTTFQGVRLGLSVDGGSADVWGSYTTSHVYEHEVIGQGRTLALRMTDVVFTDNSASVLVEVLCA